MNITFSIVTVVRNEKNSINLTLKSIEEQQSPNFKIEHILIDGVSTDGTLDIISLYTKKQQTISLTSKLVSEADKGIYDAMNKGRGLATGDFLFFLNAGDSFTSSSLLEQVYEYVLSSQNLNLIYYGNVIITSELTKWKRPYNPPSTGCHKIKQLHHFPHHQSIFYPKAFYQKQEYDINFIRFGDTEYTMLACNLFDAYYMPIDITQVTLGGFSSKAHNFKEVSRIYSDFLLLSDKYPERFNKISIVTKFVKYLAKYFLDSLFGSSYKHLFMKLMGNFRKVF